LQKVLEHRSHDELLQLVIELSARFPEVEQHIVESEQLAGGQAGKLVRALRSEIRNLTTEPAWYNHWRGEGHLPDYSHLEDKLRALADRGYADAVLQLGDELWIAGNSQVEQSDDEGETAMAIASCLDVVMAALPRSSLSPPDQLLWLIDRALEDEYSLLNAVEKVFDQRSYTRSHWQQVSSTLETRLHTLSKSGSTTSPNRYRRGRLLNALLDAYARAGWKDRIIPRLEDEAGVCQCYPRLVDELLSAGERERARQWCIQGYARTAADAPGIASTLQERLRKLAEEDERHDLVAAYRAQDFFYSPSNSSYNELRKAAEKAKSWPAVRAAALHFLETGESPGASTGNDSNKIRWPLPAPEVGNVNSRYGDRFQRSSNQHSGIPGARPCTGTAVPGSLFHAKVFNHDRGPVGELRHQFQLATHALHVVAQGGQQHVAAPFEARDGVLAHAKRRGQVFLGLLRCSPEILERCQFHGALLDSGPTFRRQRSHHVIEFSCHVSSPWFLLP
jgi:uncharacterized Zn finger protein